MRMANPSEPVPLQMTLPALLTARLDLSNVEELIMRRSDG